MAKPYSVHLKHQWEFVDDFYGAGTFATSASEGDQWVIADTSTGGTPTYVRVDHSTSAGAYALGVARLTMDSTTEVQNVCLSFGDVLCFDIDKVDGFEARVAMGQATADAATSFAIGVTSDRNDAIDSIAVAALFRVIGADSTTNLVVESDDGTNNNDDVATGTTLINVYKVLRIDLSNTADVKFYVDDAQVAAGTTFDMSNNTGGIQPFIQIQKTSDNNTDSVDIDYVAMWGRR